MPLQGPMENLFILTLNRDAHVMQDEQLHGQTLHVDSCDNGRVAFRQQNVTSAYETQRETHNK